MDFKLCNGNTRIPKSGQRTAYLTVDKWNDYSFVTMFSLSLYDDLGEYHNLGNVKIGFKGQDITTSTTPLLKMNLAH